MAPIFASPDMAALVAAFPPPTPTENRASLVRSASGAKLFTCHQVIARFRTLLETSPGRIKKSDLSSRLGVSDSDWIFDGYGRTVLYSRDGKSLLPETEGEAMRDELEARMQATAVDMAEFASQMDVSAESLNFILEHASQFRRFPLENDREMICSLKLIEVAQGKLTSAMDPALTNEIDLASGFPKLPALVISTLAQEILGQREHPGTLQCEGGRVNYIPLSYQDAKEKSAREAHDSRVSKLISQLKDIGYCQIETGNAEETSPKLEQTQTTLRDITMRFEAEATHEGTDLLSWEVANRSHATFLATKQAVEEVTEELNSRVRTETRALRQASNASTIDLATIETLPESSARPQLATAILSSNYRTPIARTLTQTLADIELEESLQFATLLRDSLATPLKLYTAGLDSISDSTLLPRLNEFLCEHFRKEVIPNFTKKAREQALLRSKPRARDLDKMVESCAEAKTMSEINSAVTRFARKQKIELPDSEELAAAKRSLLQQKTKDLQNISRGSDVLQNLVWVLLALKNEGLFMSAGKDTSRMIKYYQSIGDSETGQRLQQWRDLIKAGQESKGDLRSMKELAESSAQASDEVS